jgi:predicted transcriptional regulator
VPKKFILLSIKPRIVKEIISGDKQFEFRKKFPDLNNPDISNKIIIYCSKPTMQIIGSFVARAYYHSNFDSLMARINASEHYKLRIGKYLEDKSSCHAMEISELNLYKQPLSLNYLRKEFSGFSPGQSYRYLDPLIKERIHSLNNTI